MKKWPFDPRNAKTRLYWPVLDSPRPSMSHVQSILIHYPTPHSWNHSPKKVILTPFYAFSKDHTSLFLDNSLPPLPTPTPYPSTYPTTYLLLYSSPCCSMGALRLVTVLKIRHFSLCKTTISSIEFNRFNSKNSAATQTIEFNSEVSVHPLRTKRYC